jgi:hypothetical protein
MPNWCQNFVTFGHADPAMIQRVFTSYTGKGIMQEFHPCPSQLDDEASTIYGGDNTAEQDALRASNIENFGHDNWYDWRVANWGTKWDVNSNGNGDPAVSSDGLGVQLSFDSAWSPPLEFYGKMEELGFTVDAFYYEPGMAFCGRWSDGDDDYYEILGDSNWAEQHIPEEIDNMFAISENMSEWQQLAQEETPV